MGKEYNITKPVTVNREVCCLFCDHLQQTKSQTKKWLGLIEHTSYGSFYCDLLKCAIDRDKLEDEEAAPCNFEHWVSTDEEEDHEEIKTITIKDVQELGKEVSA